MAGLKRDELMMGLMRYAPAGVNPTWFSSASGQVVPHSWEPSASALAAAQQSADERFGNGVLTVVHARVADECGCNYGPYQFQTLAQRGLRLKPEIWIKESIRTEADALKQLRRMYQLGGDIALRSSIVGPQNLSGWHINSALDLRLPMSNRTIATSVEISTGLDMNLCGIVAQYIQIQNHLDSNFSHVLLNTAGSHALDALKNLLQSKRFYFNKLTSLENRYKDSGIIICLAPALVATSEPPTPFIQHATSKLAAGGVYQTLYKPPEDVSVQNSESDLLRIAEKLSQGLITDVKIYWWAREQNNTCPTKFCPATFLFSIIKQQSQSMMFVLMRHGYGGWSSDNVELSFAQHPDDLVNNLFDAQERFRYHAFAHNFSIDKVFTLLNLP